MLRTANILPMNLRRNALTLSAIGVLLLLLLTSFESGGSLNSSFHLDREPTSVPSAGEADDVAEESSDVSSIKLKHHSVPSFPPSIREYTHPSVKGCPRPIILLWQQAISMTLCNATGR